MKAVCAFVALAALVAGGCTGRSHVRGDFAFSSIDKVAILDVEGVVGSEVIKDHIADFFAAELSERGYELGDQVQINNMLGQHEFQTGATAPEQDAVKAGKILKVPAVLIIDVPIFGEEIGVIAKMIDVNDGSVLWRGSGSGKTGRSLASIASAGFGGGLFNIGPESETAGPMSSDMLANMPGYTLAPEEAKNVQKIIKKACKSLPDKSAAKKARRRKLWFLPLPRL